MVRAMEELPLAREVLGNADGAIPDSIGQERSSLDNDGGSQNEGLQGNIPGGSSFLIMILSEDVPRDSILTMSHSESGAHRLNAAGFAGA